MFPGVALAPEPEALPTGCVYSIAWSWTKHLVAEQHSEVGKQLPKLVCGTPRASSGELNCPTSKQGGHQSAAYPVVRAIDQDARRWTDCTGGELTQAAIDGNISRLRQLFGDAATAGLHLTAFQQVCHNLSQSRVTHVNFSSCDIGPTAMVHLCRWMMKPTCPTHVVLAGNSITGSRAYERYDVDLSSLIALGKAVTIRRAVALLDLSSCGISEAGVIEIAKFISAGSSISTLTLDSTGAIEAAGAAWAGGSKRYSLAAGKAMLDLSEKRLGPSDLHLLSAWLVTRGDCITSLNLSGNLLFGGKVEHEGECGERLIHHVDNTQSAWNELCHWLRGSAVINFIVEHIGMGPVALQTLASSLPATVTRLNLSRCGITGAIKKHGCWTQIDSNLTGFTAFCCLLSKIRTLTLSECGLGPHSCKKLSKMVYVLASLEELKLDGQPLSGTSSKYHDGDYRYIDKLDASLKGFASLCSALVASKLWFLSLRACHLGPKAIRLLTEAIKTVDSLSHLDISGAVIDQHTLDHLHHTAPNACTVLWEPPLTDTSDSDDY